MSSPHDDDALSWAGDDDPTLVSRPAKASEPAPAPGPAPVPERDAAEAPAKPSDGAGATDATDSPDAAPDTATDEEESPAQLGNAALVGLGILAGVYLLLTVGWMLGGTRLRIIGSLFLDPIAFEITFWLAVAAPAIWFLLSVRLAGPLWLRFVLLIAGAVLLVPWPFVLAGATA